jgi:uncharacterized membrane protein
MMNKSTTVAILGAIVAIAALAAALPTMTHTAYASTASTGAFATNNFQSATAAASSNGAGSSAGVIAACPNFASLAGSCSEGAG